MADRDALLALAERVERLAGPDREVDAAIYDLTPHALDYQRIGLRLRDASRLDRYHDGWVTVYGAKGEADPYPEDLLRYTRSLDAAMSLVPESIESVTLSFKVERFYLGNGIGKCRSSVWDGLGSVSSLDTAAEAATPALALTAAVLRARAAAIGSGDGL